MRLMRSLVKPLVPFMLVAFFNLIAHSHPASAAMVATDAVINADNAKNNRERLHAFLDREDVRAQIQSLGIGAEEARARVDALTEGEVSRVAASLDSFPAGGDMGIVGAVVLIFVILLFTDILGLTHIFPAISGKR